MTDRRYRGGTYNILLPNGSGLGSEEVSYHKESNRDRIAGYILPTPCSYSVSVPMSIGELLFGMQSAHPCFRPVAATDSRQAGQGKATEEGSPSLARWTLEWIDRERFSVREASMRHGSSR